MKTARYENDSFVIHIPVKEKSTGMKSEQVGKTYSAQYGVMVVFGHIMKVTKGAGKYYIVIYDYCTSRPRKKKITDTIKPGYRRTVK